MNTNSDEYYENMEKSIDEFRIVVENQILKLRAIEEKLKEIREDITRTRRTIIAYFTDPIIDKFEENDNVIKKLSEQINHNTTRQNEIKKELKERIEKTEHKIKTLDKKFEIFFKIMENRLEKIERILEDREIIEKRLLKLRPKQKNINKKILDMLV